MISYEIITKLILLYNIHKEHNDLVKKFKKLHEQKKANRPILIKNMIQG